MIFDSTIPVMTSIATTVLPRYELHAQLMRDAFNYCSEHGYMNDAHSNVQSVHTPYRTHKFYPQLEEFNKLVKRSLEQYFTDVLGFPHPVPMSCEESWIISYESSEMTKKHNHYPNMMSATYYFDVEDQTPIFFESFTGLTTLETPIVPTNGLLLLFPSNAKHSVPRCNGKRGTWASNWVYDFNVERDAFEEHNEMWHDYKEKQSKSQN